MEWWIFLLEGLCYSASLTPGCSLRPSHCGHPREDPCCWETLVTILCRLVCS